MSHQIIITTHLFVKITVKYLEKIVCYYEGPQLDFAETNL